MYLSGLESVWESVSVSVSVGGNEPLEGFLGKSENEKYFTSVLCVYTIPISLRSNFQSVLFT